MDNRNAYRTMESMSPNEDVINIRLESLELESDRYKTWRFAFIALSLFVVAGFGLSVTVSLVRGSRDSSTCRDGVKMTNPATFAPGIEAAMLTCDHPGHHGALEKTDRGILLNCTCR